MIKNYKIMKTPFLSETANFYTLQYRAPNPATSWFKLNPDTVIDDNSIKKERVTKYIKNGGCVENLQ